MISEIYQKKFSDSGYEVFAVESGEQALKIARKEKVDAVISDLMMPKMDGFEVIRNLRDGTYDPGIKIIISSNLSQKEDRDKAMQLGADGFIAKSDFSPSELVAEVNRFLNQFNEQKKNQDKQESSEPILPQSGKKKILMIEDEEIFIEMFGEKLKQDGFEVVTARNGAWGVKEAFKENFDLYIIDMVMPAMGGEEMITKLKMEDQTKNIPIIVLSASVDDETIKRVEEMGVETFFIKTQTTPGEVSNKVKEIIGN